MPADMRTSLSTSRRGFCNLFCLLMSLEADLFFLLSSLSLSILVSRRMSLKMPRRWWAEGKETGNFLGMRRRMASSMSCMRFVAPRTQMRWGSPVEEVDARPSQWVMNLFN